MTSLPAELTSGSHSFAKYFGSGVIVMDPVAAATGELPRIQEREASFGTTLSPIGEWDLYILLVADDGSVLAETSFQVLRLGMNLAEALKAMIVADTLPPEVG